MRGDRIPLGQGWRAAFGQPLQGAAVLVDRAVGKFLDPFEALAIQWSGDKENLIADPSCFVVTVPRDFLKGVWHPQVRVLSFRDSQVLDLILTSARFSIW